MSGAPGPMGFHVERRLNAVSQADWEFIWSAVEAGWTTPRIMRELDMFPADVFALTRAARAEQRDALKVCEHCRRDIATGKRPQ